MNDRRTLLLLVGLFVSLAVITLVVQRLPQRLEQPDVTPFFQSVYPDLFLQDVQAVNLQNPLSGETFTINRAADGTWTAPGREGTLDQAVAQAIARTIVLLPYTQTLPEPTADQLDDYGLVANSGTLIIGAILTDGTPLGVAVGGLTPTGTSYFALVDDRPEVYILERAAVDFLIVQLRTPPLN